MGVLGSDVACRYLQELWMFRLLCELQEQTRFGSFVRISSEVSAADMLLGSPLCKESNEGINSVLDFADVRLLK